MKCHNIFIASYVSLLVQYLLCHYAMLLSDVCLSVAYIGPNLGTERPRKTKIGTEVARVTHDLDTSFKIKRSKVNLLLMS